MKWEIILTLKIKIMKKSLVLVAMAGVALAGCVNDVADVAQKEQEKVKIAFEAPVAYNNVNETRAVYHGEVGKHQYTENGTIYTYPREENFVIYAVKHDGDFAGWTDATAFTGLNADIAVFDETVGGWAPKDANGQYYVWPSEPNTKLSFAAYSPADLEQETGWTGTVTYSDEGLKITNFCVPSDANNHFDLMFSKRVVNKTKADIVNFAGRYSGIPLEFQHALSSIRFSLWNESTSTVTLKKIEIKGVKFKGTFTEGIDENKDGIGYDKYVRVATETEETVNVNPSWDVTNDIIQNDENVTGYVAFAGELQFPTAPEYIADIDNPDNPQHDILLVMPQSLTVDATLYVTYNVGGVDVPKSFALSSANILDSDGKETSNTLNEWLMGNRYTYRLHYSKEASNADRIYFAPSTDGWKDAGIAVIELL